MNSLGEGRFVSRLGRARESSRVVFARPKATAGSFLRLHPFGRYWATPQKAIALTPASPEEPT
jgi:hypothetical protein